MKDRFYYCIMAILLMPFLFSVLMLLGCVFLLLPVICLCKPSIIIKADEEKKE